MDTKLNYIRNIPFKTLVFFALTIVVSTLWYTSHLVKKLKIEEQKKVALWAKATKELSNINNSNYDLGFVFEVVNNNNTVPVIQVSEDGKIINKRNFKKNMSDSDLKKQIRLMKKKYPPIEIELIGGEKEYIYYKDSKLLQNLKYFPLFIFSIMGAFMLLAYSTFSTARIAQQNKVWTGMAKETAHQIGTPLSSLVGWLEYLKKNDKSQKVLFEMEKDVSRLTVIAARFSKIGSEPKLEKQNIIPILESSLTYMQKRASSKINFEICTEKSDIEVFLNKDLFEWVIENIIKNSIDAINESGKISVKVKDDKETVTVDVVDNGKGIKKVFSHKIFEPGFTSKRRGWGLGLSLVKRIIKDYHRGSVDLHKSIPHEETIIRLVLNK